MDSRRTRRHQEEECLGDSRLRRLLALVELVQVLGANLRTICLVEVNSRHQHQALLAEIRAGSTKEMEVNRFSRLHIL